MQKKTRNKIIIFTVISVLIIIAVVLVIIFKGPLLKLFAGIFSVGLLRLAYKYNKTDEKIKTEYSNYNSNVEAYSKERTENENKINNSNHADNISFLDHYSSRKRKKK